MLSPCQVPFSALGDTDGPVLKMCDLLSGNHQDSTERVRGCVTLGRNPQSTVPGCDLGKLTNYLPDYFLFPKSSVIVELFLKIK